MITPWLDAAGPLAIGFSLTAGALWINHRIIGWLPDDVPRAGRKHHERPTPLVGIAVGLGVLGWLAYHLLSPSPWPDLQPCLGWLLAAVSITTAIGYYDDRQKESDDPDVEPSELDWKWKALALGLAAAAVAAIAPAADPWQFFGRCGLAFVLINAVNFLDNTDGVAGTVGGLGLIVADPDGMFGPLAGCGWIAIGFLPVNWPKPRAFLGDAGALSLGALLAGTIVLRLSQTEPGISHWPAALAPAALPLFDFVQVVSARLWLGYAPWVADRRHVTHIANWWGIPRVAIAPLCGILVVIADRLLDPPG